MFHIIDIATSGNKYAKPKEHYISNTVFISHNCSSKNYFS
ncbi:hypothetical protein FCL48_22230 [Desulforhopalus sp. IMCC35007]|nr:hypothetical protein FCL48_22230 [Desulforhopalus sp. IMCC35007]